MAEDLLDLQRWMANESDAGLHPVRVATGTPDAMGLDEYLQVIVASGGATALVACLRSWIRFRRPRVSVEVKTADGTKVTLSAENIKDDNEIIKAVARLVEHE
ncbi:effector-associated constant component EACC1 [Micromonospora arida]